MTIKDLEAMDKATISTREAASVLRCQRYGLNVKYDAGILPYPAYKSGNRLHIYREPFIKIVRDGRL